MQVHKVLCLLRNLHFKKQVVKSFNRIAGRIPTMPENDPKMIRARPETVLQPGSQRAVPARKYAHADIQSAAPATKSAHGVHKVQSAAHLPRNLHTGSQSAAPATKSSLQETSETTYSNGRTIPTMPERVRVGLNGV